MQLDTRVCTHLFDHGFASLFVEITSILLALQHDLRSAFGQGHLGQLLRKQTKTKQGQGEPSVDTQRLRTPGVLERNSNIFHKATQAAPSFRGP